MRDFELLTYREFEFYWNGYLRREKEKWRHTREILAFIHNSGMNAKKTLMGFELFPFEEEAKTVQEKGILDLINALK